MKFMVSWKIPPGSHKPAAESFLTSGAPVPAGLKLLGRWHAPGSGYGWLLLEGNDTTALAQHMAEWANFLSCRLHQSLKMPKPGPGCLKRTASRVVDLASPANKAVKLSVHAVTGRACARPAPARPAAYGRRCADARGRRSGPFGCPRVTPYLRARRLTGGRPLTAPALSSRRIGAAA